MPKHPFKWKVEGGSGHLQSVPWEVWQDGGEPGMLVSTGKLVTESRYHSPDPLRHLLGHANETSVVEGDGDDGLGGYWVPNLCPHWGILYRNGVDDPSTEEFDAGCVASQGDRGILILYKGYVEANLTIPDLPQYNEDVLCLVVANHKYGNSVLVQIGTQVIY